MRNIRGEIFSAVCEEIIRLYKENPVRAEDNQFGKAGSSLLLEIAVMSNVPNDERLYLHGEFPMARILDAVMGRL